MKDKNNSFDAIQKYFSRDQNSDLEDLLQKEIKAFLENDEIETNISLDDLKHQLYELDIPEHGKDQSIWLEEINNLITRHAINTGSPYFIGHMTSLLPSFMKSLAPLVTALNQNMVKTETAKIATLYEKQTIAILHRKFYNNSDTFYNKYIFDPEHQLGSITSGGTIANMTALQCARNISLSPYAQVESEGIHCAQLHGNFSRSVIITSELSHYSIQKSAGLLGIGRDNIIKISVDRQQSMDISELTQNICFCRENNIHIIAVVAIAGTTECGSFDNLNKISSITQEYGIYLHVDAAWGGPVIFSQKYKKLLLGIENADSITIDGHKQLYLPMGLGAVLFKKESTLNNIASEANYIIRKNSLDLGRFSIEGSRAANIFYLHAGLHLLGQQGYCQIFEKNFQTTKKLAKLIDEDDNFELITKPDINIFLYRYIPNKYRETVHSDNTLCSNKHSYDKNQQSDINDFNVKLQEIAKRRGKTFVSRTKFRLPNKQIIVALRVVLANPLTTIEHCHKILDDQKNIAQFIEKQEYRAQ